MNTSSPLLEITLHNFSDFLIVDQVNVDHIPSQKYLPMPKIVLGNFLKRYLACAE